MHILHAKAMANRNNSNTSNPNPTYFDKYLFRLVTTYTDLTSTKIYKPSWVGNVYLLRRSLVCSTIPAASLKSDTIHCTLKYCNNLIRSIQLEGDCNFLFLRSGQNFQLRTKFRWYQTNKFFTHKIVGNLYGWNITERYRNTKKQNFKIRERRSMNANG